MIKHFLKWLQSVPLPNHSSEGIAYVFIDKMFSMFSVIAKVFTNQGILKGFPKFVWVGIDRSLDHFMR
jgi:hypothetical protein